MGGTIGGMRQMWGTAGVVRLCLKVLYVLPRADVGNRRAGRSDSRERATSLLVRNSDKNGGL